MNGENKPIVKKKTKDNGFTLAEVIITLVLIGVVSAITIPALIQNIRDNQYKTGYRKAYSVVSQAFQSAFANNQLVAYTGLNSSEGGEGNFDAIKQYFSIQKECDSASLSQCWADSNEVNFRNISSFNSLTQSFIDNSGMSWKPRARENVTDCTPGILVDINGLAKPNKWGQDRFIFLYANASTSSSDLFIDDMGKPVKLLPFVDVTDSSFVYESLNAYVHCPSVDTHPCYYASWLTN